MAEQLLARKILSIVALSVIYFLVAALWMGDQRKSKWFKRRVTSRFKAPFLYRGALGNVVHFGYPVTKEGVGVTLVLFIIIAITSYCVINYF